MGVLEEEGSRGGRLKGVLVIHMPFLVRLTHSWRISSRFSEGEKTC